MEMIEKGIYIISIKEFGGYNSFLDTLWTLSGNQRIFTVSELPPDLLRDRISQLELIKVNTQTLEFGIKGLTGFRAVISESESYEQLRGVMGILWPENELPVVDNMYVFPSLGISEAIRLSHSFINADGNINMNNAREFLANNFIIKNDSDGEIIALLTHSDLIVRNVKSCIPSNL